MVVTVQVSSTAALPLHRQAPATPASQAVARLMTELGIELQALHPASDDPILCTYFTAELPDGRDGARIIERLRRDPSIAAAYVKLPAAEP